jgi:replicative DNA helicase
MPRSNRNPEEQSVGYTPPASPEAEQSVLGAILVRPEVLDDICDTLSDGDFYREAHSRIFHAMMDLYGAELPVDLVTVTQYLKDRNQLEGVGGPLFLAALSEQVGFATNATYYARVVREKAVLRRLLDVSQEIAGACFAPVENVDEFLDAAEEKIYQIKDGQEVQAVYTEADVVPPVVERLEKIWQHKQKVLGVPSGLTDLDAITGGWQNGDLIIVGARPSMGKTALALNSFAYQAAKVAQVPVAFFSMEQPKEQLVQRQLASIGGINAYHLRSAKLDGDGWARLQAAAGELMDLPIFIIDKPALSSMAIRSMARGLKSRKNIGLVIVDYLQLAKHKGARSREQEISEISGALKALAKELYLPVIALSQLNRNVEKQPNKRPQMADLRESGSQEQDADVVIFIYRDEVYHDESKDKGIAEIRVAKQRNGPTGRVKAAYLKEYMRFENLVRDE